MRVYLGTQVGTKHNSACPTLGAAVKLEPTNRPLRVLLSYFYYGDKDIGELLKTSFGDMPVDVFADSGAFSAWSRGEPIDETKYIEWVNRWGHLFSVVSGPDVIGNPKETREATIRMLSQVKGVPVLPTFHVGEDWNLLDEYAGMADYIALGGMVPFARKPKFLLAWCKKAFSRIEPTIKVHGFGMTSIPVMQAFPWYSVDSTSWVTGFRYAQFKLFDLRTNQLRTVKTNDARDILSNRAMLSSYGLTPADVRSDHYDCTKVVAACIKSWWNVEEWLVATRRGMKRGESARVYLGCVDSNKRGPGVIGEAARVYLGTASAVGGANNSPQRLGEAVRKHLV